MKKLIIWLKADKRRIAGLILIALAVLIVIFLIRSIVFGNEMAEDEPKKENNLTETERNLIIEDLNLNGDDAEDVNPDIAKKIMNLEVVISDEIVKDCLPEQEEKLTREMENFLVENDFYMDVTKASCTQEVTKNYLTKEIYMEFKLNDPARTIVSVEFRQGSSRFSFNFY